MKKYTIFGLIALFILNLIPSFASADVIPANSHPVDRCVKFTNIEAFPDIVLIGQTSGFNQVTSTVLISNQCLSKGYKFNSFKVYWNPKNSAITTDTNNILASDIENGFSIYGGAVDNTNPLAKETIEYSLYRDASGKLSLQKTKATSEYNNGVPAKVEIFSTQNNISDFSTKLNTNGIRRTSSQVDVMALQAFLNKVTTDSNMRLVVDGKYGPKTTKAIMVFQASNGLVADGIFGRVSVAKAISLGV